MVGVMDCYDPQVVSLEQAALLVRQGQVIAYPTETFWGLAALPSSSVGIERLIDLKERAPDKGLSLIVSGSQIAEDLSEFDSEAAVKVYRRLAAAFWPGPLTLVVSPSGVARRTINARVFAPDGSVALRVSSSEHARKLAELAGGLITAPSANPADLPPASSYAEVRRYFPDIVICDEDETSESSKGSGSGREQLPSTILDIRAFPFKVLRQGAISTEMLYPILE